MKILKSLIIVTGMLGSICLFFCFLFLAYEKWTSPIDEFDKQADEARPQLRELDRNTLATFPHPHGVTQASWENLCGRNGCAPYRIYGSKLTVTYDYNDVKPKTIGEYYYRLLADEGWQEIFKSETGRTSTWFKDFACFELSFGTEGYAVEIWHDFWKQDFSPTPLPVYFRNTEGIPSLYIESAVITCPRGRSLDSKE